jgi:hypothetical protein
MNHLKRMLVAGAALSMMSLSIPGMAAAVADDPADPTYTADDAGIGAGDSCAPTVDEDRPSRGADATFTVVTTPTVLYTSNFDTEDNASWSLISGTWQFADGTLAQVESCGYDASALLDTHAVIDFRWEGTFASETSNQGGLVINQQSAATRSGATLIDLTDDGTSLRWGTYDALGYYIFAGAVPIDRPADGTDITLAVEVHGADVSIAINGTTMGTLTTEHEGGLVGLVATQSTVAFTSVTLTGLGSVAATSEPSTMRTSLVDRMIFANTYVSAGTTATINGSVVAGTYFTTGVSAVVNGDTLARAATTLGASSHVSSDLRSGAAVTLGADATVAGDLQFGTTVTFGAGATSGSQTQNTTVPIIADEQQDVVAEQLALTLLPSDVVLPPGNIATDVTFTAGVYEVPGLLTFTAAKTITLDAAGEDSEFVFNIGNYLSFGAAVEVVVVNGTANTSVIWNAPAGYITVGDGANIIGTILAQTHVVVGANSTLSGADTSCSGAVYSATSYISVGAGATVGGIGTCGASS